MDWGQLLAAFNLISARQRGGSAYKVLACPVLTKIDSAVALEMNGVRRQVEEPSMANSTSQRLCVFNRSEREEFFCGLILRAEGKFADEHAQPACMKWLRLAATMAPILAGASQQCLQAQTCLILPAQAIAVQAGGGNGPFCRRS